MKLHNLIVLIAVGAANIGLAVPAIVTAVNGTNSQNEIPVDEQEDLTGVTSVKIIKNPNKTAYQEGELFNPEGMMCLITQNGVKKIVKKNFEVVNPAPLVAGATSVRCRYGDMEFDVPIKVIQFISVLTVDKNGSYVIEAEDERIPIDGYIEADAAWSAQHYDGVNPVTKFVESWTNSRVTPSSGRSLANIAVGSVLGFKFTLTKACTLTISANMAMYDTRKPCELLEFRLDDEIRDDVDRNLVLTHLDGDDSGAKYFNWQNWSMGTYDLEAGNHSFTLTVKDFKLPNLDSFKLVATNMEGGDHVNITSNGTQTLQATDGSLDKSNWVKDSEQFDFVENWNNNGATYLSATSGQSIGHLANGSKISFSLGLKGRGRVTIKPIIAHVQASKASGYLNAYVDSTKLTKDDFGMDDDLTLGSSGVSTYWNWKGWTAGTIDLAKGSHIVLIEVVKSCNIYGFEITTSNYQDGEYGVTTIKGNGDTRVEAESGLLDRSGWSIREDFINAGRQPIEAWNNSGATSLSYTSGRSLCGLNTGCVITIPFESKGNCTLTFKITCAYSAELNASQCFTIKLDGEDMTSADSSLTLGSSGVSTYWNWKDWTAGQSSLSTGQHVITVKFDQIVNVDSFVFSVTGYSA